MAFWGPHRPPLWPHSSEGAITAKCPIHPFTQASAGQNMQEGVHSPFP